MNREAITIAGERFVDLDAALDRVEVVVEAEFLAHGHDPCREWEWDPVRRLIAMMGRAKSEGR